MAKILIDFAAAVLGGIVAGILGVFASRPSDNIEVMAISLYVSCLVGIMAGVWLRQPKEKRFLGCLLVSSGIALMTNVILAIILEALWSPMLISIPFLQAAITVFVYEMLKPAWPLIVIEG